MAALAGMALISCSEPHSPTQQSATGSLRYESAAPVTRTPLAPLGGYAATPPSPGYGEQANQTAPGWQASPRWAAIKGKGCIEVEPESAGQGGMKVEACPGDKAEAPPRAPAESEPQAQDEAFGLPPE
jgi:hypothetical protein